MNTSHDNHDHLRHAEYVLGVLDADARADVERELREDPKAAASVAWWQRKLAPLIDEIPATAPPEYVWARIRDELGFDPEALPTGPTPSRGTQPRRSWWNSLPLWRGWGLAASAVAVACLVLLFTLPQRMQAPAPSNRPPAQQLAYMVSNIQQTGGAPAWTATMDVTHARMIVTPSGKVSVPRDHTAELWLIPPGHKPVAVGLLPAGKASVVQLPANLVAQLGPKAILAVSIEPPGGSPTGQPTGPVIAKGAINTAASPSA